MREVIKQREKREVKRKRDRDGTRGASLKAECAEGVYKRTQSSAFKNKTAVIEYSDIYSRVETHMRCENGSCEKQEEITEMITFVTA